MKDKDIFKDVFSEKLGNFEAPVRPELWSSISSQIGTTAATSVASGMSFLSKLIIGGSISAAVVTGAILLYPSELEVKEIAKENKESIEISVEKHTSTIFEKSSSKEINPSKTIEINTITQTNTISCQFGPVITQEEIVPFITPITNNVKINKVEPSQKVIEEPLVSTSKEDKNTNVSTPIVDENVLVSENKSSVKLNLPNIFTPNNDGKADLFYIESTDLTNFSLVIFDSKNNIIFKSDDPSIKWDGIKLNGDMVEEGKYMYILTATDNLGKEISEYRFLTISRN